MRVLLRSLLPVVLATSVVATAAPSEAATTACVPVTIDGVDVACVTLDVSVNQQPSSTTVTTTAIVTVDGQQLPPIVVPVTAPIPSIAPCVFANAASWPGVSDPLFYLTIGVSIASHCNGFAVGIDNVIPNVGVGSTNVPYHVPQICLTTTNTCVGGSDGTLAIPTPGISGSEQLCVGEVTDGTVSSTIACVPILPLP
jgi:hypothetical protein